MKLLQKVSLVEKFRAMAITQANRESNFLSEKNEEDILGAAGFRNVLDVNKRNRRELDMLRKYGEAISYDSIKEVGLKYGLVFALTAGYKGGVGENTAQRLMGFSRKYNVNISPDKVYILAPKEMFAATMKKIDPVLFYKVGDNHFYLIDQWGGDLSPGRRAYIIAKTIIHGAGVTIIWSLGAGLYFGAVSHSVLIGSVASIIIEISLLKFAYSSQIRQNENGFDVMYSRSLQMWNDFE